QLGEQAHALGVDRRRRELRLEREPELDVVLARPQRSRLLGLALLRPLGLLVGGVALAVAFRALVGHGGAPPVALEHGPDQRPLALAPVAPADRSGVVAFAAATTRRRARRAHEVF